MSYSQLLNLHSLLNEEQFEVFLNYFSSLSKSCKLTISSTSSSCSFESGLVKKIFGVLVDEKILKYSFAVRCPECDILLVSADSIADLESEIYCYNCDEHVDISPGDVDVIYVFDNYPFAEGQQNYSEISLSSSVALSDRCLDELIKDGKLDLNNAFFSPTEKEYKELESLYLKIFETQKTTKEKGDTLENLTCRLFSICKHFSAAPLKLHPNQIDCFVRNKLYLPGISSEKCKSNFTIECKNEATKPKAGYVNKLHSILRVTGNSFGIIVSKEEAPKTFVELANNIFLREDIVIISIDKDDLKHIIFDRTNLLELMERKIDEVKLKATKDLVSAGLYEC